MADSILKLKVGEATYDFGQDGFIRSIKLETFGGGEFEAAKDCFSRINIKLSDGRVLVPYTREGTLPSRGTFKEAEIVEFPAIYWRDSEGVEIPEFRLALRYELWDGGRAFVTAFFAANTMQSPLMDEFSLKFDLAVSKFKQAKFAIMPRPQNADGALIQTICAGRNLERGDSRHADSEIIPSVSVNAKMEDGQSAFFEIVVDGKNSISEHANDNYTDVKWHENGDLSCEYGFIKDKPLGNEPMKIHQWRNEWGWVLKFADRTRHKPPFHMYHYLDNYRRYPTNECIENASKSGCDVLVIHENWRMDIQNDGFPYDPAELDRVIEKAHSCRMRVMLYMRGDECSAVESSCEWFRRHLKKNYDGLYMDYGGPCHISYANEAYPGGRIEFRRYFLRMRQLRRRVGEEGLFYAHTGPSFSSIAFTGNNVDSYVSGEGEGGVMVSGRDAHEYYSMASVCPGTMWTGAFPAYSSAAMRPFLAATGQYPHSPLGVQFISSSLAHPQEPGINDTAFKPLWKLWRFFRDERDIKIFNDYNSSGVFRTSSPDAGHYFMVSKHSHRGLLIVANFGAEKALFTTQINYALADFDPAGYGAWKLTPTESTPGKAEKLLKTDKFEFELAPNDVAAVYFDTDKGSALEKIEDFEHEYPGLSKSNLEHLAYVRRQKELRYSPVRTEKLFMRLAVSDTNQSYEFSLVYDLYLNSMQLVEFMPDGTERHVAWISKNGFVKDEPLAEDYVWVGTKSVWMPIHEVVGEGEHFLGIKSLHFKKPFYTFESADFSFDEKGTDAQTLQFVNELEPEREYLRFKVNIGK